MSYVFVIDQQRKPLAPVHPGRARFLLKAGHAAVLRRYPFVIILKGEKQEREAEPLRLKIDPGSKTSGLAVVNDQTGNVLWAAELTHRGSQVKEKLEKRRAWRRSRRHRKTRYRKPRFANRSRKKGWVPPSLKSRIDNIVTWTRRIRTFCPIGAISQELVRFDTQLLEHPTISGVEYQQGTLAGYETKEYLLLKWGHQCAYCQKQEIPLEIEHLIPRSRGGSNRVSNLALACRACNQKKGNLSAEAFGFAHLMADIVGKCAEQMRLGSPIRLQKQQVWWADCGREIWYELSSQQERKQEPISVAWRYERRALAISKHPGKPSRGFMCVTAIPCIVPMDIAIRKGRAFPPQTSRSDSYPHFTNGFCEVAD